MRFRKNSCSTGLVLLQGLWSSAYFTYLKDIFVVFSSTYTATKVEFLSTFKNLKETRMGQISYLNTR